MLGATYNHEDEVARCGRKTTGYIAVFSDGSANYRRTPDVPVFFPEDAPVVIACRGLPDPVVRRQYVGALREHFKRAR